MIKIFRFISASIIFVSVTVFICLSCGENQSVNKNNAPTSAPQRIISFAPSITEILYELEVDDKIAGVTNFCNYPPEAGQKTKIGDFANFNYEMILRLKPDLAITLKEQQDIIPFLDKYKIRRISVGSDSIDEIITSIQTIAEACLIKNAGDSIAQNLRRQIEQISASADHSSDRPKIFLCVGRDNIGSGAVTKCFAGGAASFYNQLIEIAGGTNVLKDIPQAYPAIGTEAIVRLNPDIVIDISSSYSKEPLETICGDWASLKTVAAVRTNNVHCLSGDYLTRPGPRFLLILERFKSIFE